jgi:hypothetical protein
VFEAPAGAELRNAGEERGGWVLVENSDGVVGWIPGYLLRGRLAREAIQEVDPPAEAAIPVARTPASRAQSNVIIAQAPAGPGPAARLLARPRWFRLRAGLGASSFDMDFSSNGNGALGAYGLSATAMAASVDGELGLARGRLRAALDGGYRVTLGLPGIRAHDAENGALDPVGFTWHTFNAGAKLGYLVAEGWAPHVRAGYHFDWFRVDDVTNPGRISRDGLRGATIGAGVEGTLGDELMVRAGGDLLIGGSRRQTPGLEDGQRSSARGAWARLEASYLVSSAFQVEGNYQYGFASTEWTGQSTRQADVTRAVRTDHTHTLLVSLVRDF